MPETNQYLYHAYVHYHQDNPNPKMHPSRYMCEKCTSQKMLHIYWIVILKPMTLDL